MSVPSDVMIAIDLHQSFFWRDVSIRVILLLICNGILGALEVQVKITRPLAHVWLGPTEPHPDLMERSVLQSPPSALDCELDAIT